MTGEELTAAVRGLFAGGRDAAVRREQTAFDDALAAAGQTATRNVVLFGAGGVGRRSLVGLRGLGIEPLAFADNNPALWGQKVNGVPVMSVPDAAAKYGTSALFVISIWRGEDCRMADQRKQLADLGVTNAITFGPLFWKAADRLLPHYALDFPHKLFDRQAEVLAGCDLWADARSRAEYLAQIRWRVALDFEGLPDPVGGDIYFPEDVIRLTADEVFVDCGAYDGDTIRTFVRRTGGAFRHAVAIEPDTLNYVKLQNTVAALPADVRAKVEVHPFAVGATAGPVTFAATGTPASGVGAAAVGAAGEVGAGDVTVECVRLDDLLRDAAPTFVKMDIEGAEPDALAGMAETIRRHRPILAVCSYHVQDHTWTIPHLIRKLGPDYRLYLRPHLFAVWDLVCYAVPPERVVG